MRERTEGRRDTKKEEREKGGRRENGEKRDGRG